MDSDTPAGNAVVNGDFSDGLHRWIGGAWENNTGHFTVENDTLRFNIEDVIAGEEDKLVAQQQFIPVTGGEVYELSFSARAESERDILIQLSAGSVREEQTFTLNTSMAEYSIEIAVPTGANHANLTLAFGHDTDDVWVDDVQLIAQ